MAAPHRDPVRGARPSSATSDALPPATTRSLSVLGTLAAAAGILAVLLVASDAPPAVRAPVVLVAALLLPGFPLVARLRADLPTVIAVDVCVSLALEAGAALLLVQAELFYPRALGLALAAFGVGGTLTTLAGFRAAEARHLT